jgi:hypothetical protein
MDALERQRMAEAMQQADNMAAEHENFIRKHATLDDTVVYKENDAALVAAVEPERHWIDNDELVRCMGEVVADLRQEFAGTNRRLKTRVKELEREVAELRGELAAFNRIATIAEQVALAWMNKK